jgi:hypothetical protein
MSKPRNEVHARPNLGDWAAFGLGLSFVLGGLCILPKNRDVGIVTIAFLVPAR